MTLAEIPLVLILVGLGAYVVLAGADFGAGFWELTARGRLGARVREHAHRAMAPVWEANHVWLIFVLVLCWTAYPTAFGSIFSTLAVPLLLAAIGIILRGASYAARSAGESPTATVIFSASSIVTPFALGTAIGGIASRRVPTGNAQGDLFTSWLNPTSLTIGALAVATSVYLAAVYLAADASRTGSAELTDAFRSRALAAGGVAGALALAGLAVVNSDAEALFDGLSRGAGLAAVLVSVVGGAGTLLLVWRARYQWARFSAAVAVAAIVAGWGLGHGSEILPGLSIEDAAAGDATLEALLIGVAGGLLILVPSLFLLFGLVLRGRFDAEPAMRAAPAPHPKGRRTDSGPARSVAVVALIAVGMPLTLFADGVMFVLGLASMLGFIAAGFALLVSADRLAG